MPLYRAGKVSLTVGSKAVTGIGTAFGNETAPGDILVLSSQYYEIFSIEADTALTLDTNATATAIAEDYVVIRSVSTANNLYLMRKIDEFLKDRQVSLVEFRDWVQGGPRGGPNGDGLYPMTDRFGVTTLVKSPEAMQEGLLETLLQADETLELLGGLDAAVAAAGASALSAASAVTLAESAATEATEMAGALAGLDEAVRADAQAAGAASAAAQLSNEATSISEAAAASSAREALVSQQAAGVSASEAATAIILTSASKDAAAVSGVAAKASEVAAGNSASSSATAAAASQASESQAGAFSAAAFDSKNLAAVAEGLATAKAASATTQANRAEAERILAEAAKRAAQDASTAASMSEVKSFQSAAIAAQAAADAGGIVLGEVFDDTATSNIRGWTAEKISAEITIRVEERVSALPDAVALSLVFGS